MNTFIGRPTTLNRLYIAAYLLCTLAFIFPYQKLGLGGEVYYQYLLTSYQGWAFFAVVALLGILQAFLFVKTKNWSGWIGLISGLYILGFASFVIQKSYSAFSEINKVSLASELKATSEPYAGLWLLAVGGFTLLFTGLRKILAQRSQ